MSFNAKILLFGEYLVLHNSDALLIPLSRYSGELAFINTLDGDSDNTHSNRILVDFYNDLIKEYRPESLTGWFDLTQLKHDVDAGLYFDSDIPVGYGVGSSGALVAALFDKYSKFPLEHWKKDLTALKTNLSVLESYFHGKSSGLDPLLSYLDSPIFLQNNKIILDENHYADFNPFLIDTKKSRATEGLVNLFNEKCLSTAYFNIIQTRLITANNQCIQFLRKGDKDRFFSSLKELSVLQLEYFREMILPEYESVWMQGLDSGEFYLKLCGAGGGGYLLGFATDKQVIKQLKNEVQSEVIEII
ncbi:MAG: mevalonate kinase [Bacteroidetes bacterium]|nr:mevalonate kinase [Bacteroidota bacterium]